MLDYVRYYVHRFFYKIFHFQKEPNKTITVAHRGASGYAPENTFAAFDLAIDMKADYLELDVRMTKDGLLAVIHDETIDRTTNGSGLVKNFTYEELKQFDAGAWFHRKFSGEKIPLLCDVLKKYRGKINFLIEVKEPKKQFGIVERLAKELIEKGDQQLNVVVQSFDTAFLQEFHSVLPSISLGVLIGYRHGAITEEHLQQYAAFATYINPNKALVTPKLVYMIHQSGMKIMPYTARDIHDIQHLMDMNVDGIITDYPDYLTNLPKSPSHSKRSRIR